GPRTVAPAGWSRSASPTLLSWPPGDVQADGPYTPHTTASCRTAGPAPATACSPKLADPPSWSVSPGATITQQVPKSFAHSSTTPRPPRAQTPAKACAASGVASSTRVSLTAASKGQPAAKAGG